MKDFVILDVPVFTPLTEVEQQRLSEAFKEIVEVSKTWDNHLEIIFDLSLESKD